MTPDELRAHITERIAADADIRRVLAAITAQTADLSDSQHYALRSGEISGKALAAALLDLDASERSASVFGILWDRYRDENRVFDEIQAILDKQLGIHLAPQHAAFPEARAKDMANALCDDTADPEALRRRAESAGNIIAAMHDGNVRANAEFRDRAGLQSSAIREGGAKCCEWCASVSGKYPASDTPQGFWGRHDNCKCSILYETRKGVQRLGGSAKKWEPLRDAGAPEPTRLTAEQAAEREAQHPVIAFSPEQAEALQAEKGLTILPRNGTINSEEKSFYSDLVESGGFSYHDDGTMVVTDDWKSKGKVIIPKLYNPYAVIESVTSFRDGTVQIDRSLYNSEGVLSVQIHSAGHHKPKQHPFGIHGEHHHYYTWTDGQEHPNRTTDELTDQERKEHGDLL